MKGKPTGLPKDLSDGVVNAIDRQCFRFGDEAAVELVGAQGEVEELGYSELQQYSKAVGAQLQHRFGASPLDNVLLLCPDACIGAQLSCILACARIRAVFVPIDESWLGTAKLRYIVSETKATVALVVADKDTDPSIQALAKVGVHKTVYVQANGDLVYEQAMDVSSLEENTKEMTSDLADVFYLLYTSGSSSIMPKGVQGTEVSLLNRIAWQWEAFPYAPGERCCKRSPLVFVDAMAELFAPLLSGIPLVASTSLSTLKDIVDLTSLAARHAATRITMLPSQLALVLSSAPPKWPSLRFLVVSGEPLHVDVANDFVTRYPRSTLLNLYGSTEMAGDVSFYAMAASKPPIIDAFQGIVSIGKAIRNCEMRICKEDVLKEQTVSEVKDGVHGELVVSGMPLSNGYLNDKSPHAFFVANGTAKMRVYRTGDRAMVREGLLYYLGRTDQLVKINGVRVSIEEAEYNIRNILKSHASESALAFTGSQLALFIVANDVNSSSEAVLDKLRPRLPKQQMPSSVHFLDSLARTVSGKCDKQKLKRMLEGSPDGHEPNTHNAVERLVQQVLGVDSLNPQRTFEQNGGDSGTLIQLRWKLKQALGLLVDLDTLQRYTIDQLCTRYECPRSSDLSLKEVSPKDPDASGLKKRKRVGNAVVSWATKLQRCVDADPCFVESLGHVFVGSHGGDVVAIDCATGMVVWQTQLDTRIEAGVAYSGPEGLIYVPTYFALDVEQTGKHSTGANRGKLFAIISSSGVVAWEHSCRGEIKASPIVLDDYILFGAYDRTLHILSKRTGEKHASVGLQGDVRAKPVPLKDNMLCVATTGGSLEFISAQTWQVVQVFTVHDRAPVFATPVLNESQNTLVYTAVSGRVECLSFTAIPGQLTSLWSFECRKALFTSPTIIEDRIIFAGHDTVLRAVHCATGELNWALDLGSVVYADPFPLSSNTVVVATTKGSVMSVDAATGKVMSAVELPGEVYSSGCRVSCCEGSVVVGCRDNYVRQIKMV